MKKISFGALLFVLALAGCTENMSPATSSYNDKTISQIDAVQKKIIDCIAQANQSADAKYINEHIFAIMRDNPNSKELFNSSRKITADQIIILKRYKDSTLHCRLLSNDLPRASLIELYNSLYKDIDAIYADLLAGRISIGVANQERAIRIQYAKNQWYETINSEDRL